ncbi:MAG: lamin tail domain-containing protein [Candidatus Staskawiczbacteria bacterium]|nr:lamin tail domain-containing protein [Candidatus Staskawiczbacteria bacterium]
MKRVLFLIIIFLFLSYSIKTWALEQFNVVINEVAWMGTTVSANDEWIELKNNTDQNVSLSGWTLRAADGAPEVELTGSIPANGFYLLERTDDNTVPGITADLIYKGALGNNGEDLWLYDSNNNLIDEVNCSTKWFAGNNTTKQTMEKMDSLFSGSEPSNWQTSENTGGTPKSQNSSGIATNNETETDLVKTDNLTAYLEGIILNEVLPAPEGADEENEWVELYNTNNSEVDLSYWKIKDTEGSIISYSIPKNTKISAYGYLVFKRPNTKIILNNTTDGLALYWPNDKVIDSMSYENATVNQSYNKTPNGWQWSSSLTPGVKNIVILNGESENLLKIEKSDSSKENNTGLANISQSINQEETKNINPWFLLIVALLITTFSVVALLFIKFKTRLIK